MSGDTAEKKFDWAGEYMPWRLTFKAMFVIGKQAAVLLFVYVQICAWNPKNHLVIMHCRTETLGLWVYPCEVTKAFARGFPLLAASTSMVAAGRFILQRRLFYHLYMRGAILDYVNYKAWKDAVLLTLILCFTCSMLHFVLDYCFPPFITVQKVGKVLSVYIVPCSVFFALFGNIYDIEKHLLPLPTAYEEDTEWAKKHFANADVFSAIVVRDSVAEAKQRLRSPQSAHRGTSGVQYSLTDLLDETIKVARTGEIHNLEELDKESRRFTGLFGGLWPGSILLDPCLSDAPSKRFMWAWRTFSTAFFILQIVVFGLLFSSAWQEGLDAMPQSRPHGALEIGGSHYTVLGDGYCRGDSMQRPYGYYVHLGDGELPSSEVPSDLNLFSLPAFVSGKLAGSSTSNLQSPQHHVLDLPPTSNRGLRRSRGAPSKRVTLMSGQSIRGDELCGKTACSARDKACGQQCSFHEACIGYATDPDLCSLYFSKQPETPEGWVAYTEVSDSTWRRGERAPRVIVQTNDYDQATCFIKVSSHGEPEDAVACAVYALHAILVLWIIVQAVRQALVDRLSSF